MAFDLTSLEARVIGCLIEKQITTPEQYPLSINALTNACNQKSNRDPVMQLDEATVQQVVDGLMKKRLVSDRSGYGGRVTKYKQIFCNTELGPLQFTDIERAIVCELLLRGPQSPGELRARGSRMARISEVAEVERALDSLSNRPDGPFVVRLPKAPGTRESRYTHVLGEATVMSAAPEETETTIRPAAGLAERVSRLEAEVATLRAEFAELKGRPS